MTPEQEGLAKALVELQDFMWLPGMHSGDGWIVLGSIYDGIAQLTALKATRGARTVEWGRRSCRTQGGGVEWVEPPNYPDLDDWATIGCLQGWYDRLLWDEANDQTGGWRLERRARKWDGAIGREPQGGHYIALPQGSPRDDPGSTLALAILRQHGVDC